MRGFDKLDNKNAETKKSKPLGLTIDVEAANSAAAERKADQNSKEQ
jgi:hypothetical protein